MFFLHKFKPRKFEHIISLGYNCEISFRIEDFLGRKVESYPFSWIYINDPIDNFLNILNKIDDLLSFSNKIDIVPWGMFRDINYNVLFHSKGPVSEIFDNNQVPIKSVVKLRTMELKSRFKYLVSKFKKLLLSGQNTLFVLKVFPDTDLDHTIFFIRSIEFFFRKNYFKKNFLILIVIEKSLFNKKLQKMNSKYVQVRFIEKYANDAHTDTDGDLDGWKCAFSSVFLKK